MSSILSVSSSIHIQSPSDASTVDKSGTHINDLQNLIKEKIFGYIDGDELQIVRTVCRSWYYLINRRFGIKTVIDNQKTELIRQSPWVVDLEVVNLTRPVPVGGISFAHCLRHLYFKGIVVSYNLIPFLSSCRNLESLAFDEPTVDLPLGVLQSLSPHDLTLLRCRRLELYCWSFTESLNTIVSLLTLVKFKNLKELSLKSVHPPMLPIGYLFAKAPRRIPESVSPFMTLILLNLEELEVLSVGTLIQQNKFQFILGTGREEGTVVQLSEVHLPNLFMSWTPILESQTQLTTLSIGHCQAQQWAEIRLCITRCENTLQKVEIQGRTFGVPWECDVFNECIKLETLHLNLSLSPKRLIDTLPRTLTELELDGPIELSELEHLERLTSLRKLSLNSLGMNLMILFPGNGEEPEQNGDTLSLRLIFDLISNMEHLELISFKDCSQDALEWTKINPWCHGLSSQYPAITFHEHYYDIHGQRIQHGITLKFPPNFNRQELPAPPNMGDRGQGRREGTGFFENVLRLFRF